MGADGGRCNGAYTITSTLVPALGAVKGFRAGMRGLAAVRAEPAARNGRGWSSDSLVAPDIVMP